MVAYQDFFAELAPDKKPYSWQIDLASYSQCRNHLIRIPTGFGKTLGVLSAWLWHRFHNQDNTWPRRLVWCLPMRVLVEQTANETLSILENMGILFDGTNDHEGKVGVHLLMGGADCGDWHLFPEECAVLIGTQDMLLSRAMNRGYATPRARWPMEFGLLNHDALWVMDEVQLMDVGLASSAQLQAFRDDDAALNRVKRPCYTWWMSATLQSDWLEKSPDTLTLAENLISTVIPKNDRTGHLWDNVSKPCRIEVVKDMKAFAGIVSMEHFVVDRPSSAPTLVVLNTVKNAVELYETLLNDKSMLAAKTDIRLVHSRFRPAERVSWQEDFLNKNACKPGTNRIIISTQVIEAGVDISSSLLFTELAPWSSLVQRFGRCARWGGTAKVIIADLNPKDDRAAAPYAKSDLDAAREALKLLTDLAPLSLEAFEEEHTTMLPSLYSYEPKHFLLRNELNELFDTSPDLSGADTDISRFIRTGDERDLHVFWENIPAKDREPSPELRPSRVALCAVPFLAAQTWLCGKETKDSRKPRLKEKMRAWVWDWLDGKWRQVERKDLYPGQVVLVGAECGGYDYEQVDGIGIGWSPDSKKPVIPVSPPVAPPEELADGGQDNEVLSIFNWKTIIAHGWETGVLAENLAQKIVPEYADLFNLAGRWHDIGKAHPAFQDLISAEDRPTRRDLAKAPANAWSMQNRRKGFRHELASVLGLFAVLRRHKPDHPALLGPWLEFMSSAGMEIDLEGTSEYAPTPLEEEILSLDADQFNLVAYLVCTHHGKVRFAWHASPADQQMSDSRLRIKGIQDGEMLPSLPLYTKEMSLIALPESHLNLSPSYAGLNPETGQGWTERVLSLLEIHGPYTLAWFEAILRSADQRVSRTPLWNTPLDPEVTSC